MSDPVLDINDSGDQKKRPLLICSFYDRVPDNLKCITTWRCPAFSAIILSFYILFTVSLRYLSLVSVIAYMGLMFMMINIMLKLYTQFYLGDNSCHPLEKYLEEGISDTFYDMKKCLQNQLDDDNSYLYVMLGKWRKLVLLEDYVDAVKFGALMVLMIYVGGCINLLDLIDIVVLISMIFPVIYINYQQQIDDLILLCLGHINKTIETVKEKLSTLPVIGPKLKSQ